MLNKKLFEITDSLKSMPSLQSVTITQDYILMNISEDEVSHVSAFSSIMGCKVLVYPSKTDGFVNVTILR